MIEIVYVGIIYIFLVGMFVNLFLSFKNKNDKNKTFSKKKFDYYFLVPCVDEEQVIYRTIESLLNLHKTCKIIAIDDGSKDNTFSIMKKFDTERCIILKREFPNAQKGKGEALNEALHLCIRDVEKQGLNLNNVIVGVIDADGRLSFNSIKELERVFNNDNVAAVQMRVKMYPDFKNILQVAQDIEFFTVNNISQRARRVTNTVGLSGNGQFFRLGPILKNIGNSPWGTSLLDDYELTLKIMLKGLQIEYISEAYVFQEALISTSKFIRQRSRWVQGNLDCLSYAKLVASSNQLNVSQKLNIFYFLSQPFLNIIADVCIIVLICRFLVEPPFFLNLLGEDISSLFILFLFSIIWGIFFTWIYYKALKAYKEKKPSRLQFFLLPISVSYMYTILFFSIVIAFWRKLTKQSSWLKTKRN